MHLFEIIEGHQDYVVSTLEQANRSQQLQHQSLRAQLLMHQRQRDAGDGLRVLNHHVEAVLVVHDCAQTHDAHVNVVRNVADFALTLAFRGFSKLVTRELLLVCAFATAAYGQAQLLAGRSVM